MPSSSFRCSKAKLTVHTYNGGGQLFDRGRAADCYVSAASRQSAVFADDAGRARGAAMLPLLLQLITSGLRGTHNL